MIELIKMRKIILLFSFAATFLLIGLSCSSVIAYQSTSFSSVQENEKTTLRLPRLHTFVTTMKEKISEYKDTVIPDPARLLTVLLFTILTETVVYKLAIPASVITLLLLSVVINSLTNPAINVIYYTLYQDVFVLESAVVLVETMLIFLLFSACGIPLSLVQSFALSAVANLSSYIIATSLTRLLFDGSLTGSST